MDFLKKYSAYIIGLSPFIALIFPQFGLLLKPYSTFLLGCIMTISFLNIEISALKKEFKNWREAALISAAVLIIAPILCLPFSRVIPSGFFVGLILVCATPVAVSAAAMTDIMDGDTSKSLAASVYTHLLSPLLTPLMIWLLAGKVIEVKFTDISGFILQTILIPFACAYIIKILKLDKQIKPQGQKINVILIFCVIWSIVAGARETVFGNLNQIFWITIALIIVSLVEIGFGFLVGKTKKQKATIGLIGLYRNFTLASVLAGKFFPIQAVLAPAIYTILMRFATIPLQIYCQNCPKDEICSTLKQG